MQRQIIVPKDEKEWLKLRLEDVTSTQSPALFDLSPYLTKFELYHAKANGLVLDFEENDRMKWGKRLEPAIAAGVAEDHGWQLRHIKEYIRIPELRMGSSFDYEVVCPKRGKGILEIKNVDYLVHRDNWIDDQAPEHIEIQLQHQLEVKDDCNWGMIAAFVGGNRVFEYERDRDQSMGKGICRTVKKFWSDVQQKVEPDPNFYRDAEIIKKLYGGNGEMSDKTSDQEFTRLASAYMNEKATRLYHEKEEAALQAQLLRSLGNASGAYTLRHKIKTTAVRENHGTMITPEMVGTTVGARKQYYRLNVTDMGKADGKSTGSTA